MEIALMDPEVGYYARRDTGPGATADYLTSPEVHSAFAVLLTGQFREMWEYLGEPSPFWLVELGAGTGAFLADVLLTATHMSPRFEAALNIAIVEPSSALRRRQEEQLLPHGARVRWLDPDVRPVRPIGPGCVFANEVLDALPVHRVIMRPGGLREFCVAGDGSSIHDLEAPLSSSAISEQLLAGGGLLAAGQQGEVSLAAPRLVQSCARLVSPGYVLFLDYGDPATTLYGARNPTGTLRCYWRHTVNRNPYSRVGEQDITSHVDLSTVSRAGEGEGMGLLGVTRQSRLLERLGSMTLADTIRGAVPGRAQQRAHLAALSLLAEPRELGRLAAIVFGIETPGRPLTGFTEGMSMEPQAHVELLEWRSDPTELARTATRRG
jgi:SAM-dependent MidA family methyltransferase